jgi:hypothetical protein
MDQVPLVAIDDGIVDGGTGVALPRTCQPTAAQRLRFLSGTPALGLATAARMVRWLGAWVARDLGEPHVYLGPKASIRVSVHGRDVPPPRCYLALPRQQRCDPEHHQDPIAPCLRHGP